MPTRDHYVAALAPLVQDAVQKIEPLDARKLRPPRRLQRPGSPLDPRTIPYVVLRWSQGAPRSQIAEEVGCGRRVLYTLVLNALYVHLSTVQIPLWKRWGVLHLRHFDPGLRDGCEEHWTVPVCGLCRAPLGLFAAGLHAHEQLLAEQTAAHLIAHVPIWEHQGPRFGRRSWQRAISRAALRRVPPPVWVHLKSALEYVERIRQLGEDAARTEWPEAWQPYCHPWCRGIYEGLRGEGYPSLA